MKPTPASARKSAARQTAARKTPASKPSVRAPAARKRAPRPAGRAGTPGQALRTQVELDRTALENKKGEQIAVQHLAGVSSVTDYMILCSGLNSPHLRALADEVVKQLRHAIPPVAPHRRAGSPHSEWLVLDYIDFVVHLFTPRMRAYYALEQLWKDAPVVP
jgi:ribosome-associated protein